MEKCFSLHQIFKMNVEIFKYMIENNLLKFIGRKHNFRSLMCKHFRMEMDE